jgi:hypothetical protein
MLHFIKDHWPFWLNVSLDSKPLTILVKCFIWLKTIYHLDQGCKTWLYGINQINQYSQVDPSKNTCHSSP